MAVPIYVVDAFASRPFSGNPAGVCLLKEPADPAWMQKVASEMKHAETAFVHPLTQGFSLRWFTPSTEVDLCGHATLASAHTLWEAGFLLEDEAAEFHTKSGVLTCTRHGYGIQMDFPAERIIGETPPEADALKAALGIRDEAERIDRNRMDFFVVLKDESRLKEIDPDLPELTKIGSRGVIVTAKSASDDFDFVSRFFAPAAGVPEDPVTGSAHCCLGPYWSDQLGKPDLVGYQSSERGGTVRVGVRGDRVLLQGHAITTLIGEFLG